jgi:hypothetical protein
MTLSNNWVISNQEKEAIAETVHETLTQFRDELKRDETSGYAGYIDILEGVCFYYAALGVEVCKKFYQQEFNDTESDYTLKAGSFLLRPYKDKTQNLKWFKYSGDIIYELKCHTPILTQLITKLTHTNTQQHYSKTK